MKKFGKTLALLAAGALLFGSVFMSCSSDDDDGGNDEKTAITITVAENSSTTVEQGGTVKLVSNVEGVTWTSDSETTTVDADSDDATGKTAVVTAGSVDETVTITAHKDGDYTDGTIEITVGTGGSGDDPAGEDPTAVTYKAEEITEAELAEMSPVPSAGTNTKLDEGTYSIWSGSGSIVTAAGKMAIQINAGKTVPVAIVSATNMTGATATAVPTVGANLSSIGGGLVNYIKVATPSSGKTSITLNISCDAPSSTASLGGGMSEWNFWVLATDTDGKILALKALGDLRTETYAAQDIDLGTAVLGDTVCIGFARAASSGGLKIHSITLTKTAKSAAESTPAAANFTPTACTTTDQNDGKITIANETVSSLEYKLSTADDYADVESETLTGLAAGTYLFRYKETDEYLASEAISVEVKNYVDESIVFEKFDAADVNPENSSKLNLTSSSYSDKDVTWTLTSAEKSYAQVTSGTFQTYDYDATDGTGYSWTNRLSFNMKSNVSLALKVGAGKTKILRIDGGSVTDLQKYTDSTKVAAFTFKDASETAQTWSPKVALSTYYVTVTGDSDGYVTITASTEIGMNIYGITVVDSAVDLTGKTREEVKYNNPTFTLAETASIASGSFSVTLEAGAKATQTTFTASVDGTSVTTADSDLTDVTFTYAWSKDGKAIEDATSATYEATEAGSYTVTASYTAADEKSYSATSSACTVTNLNQSDVTVTFDANNGSGTMDTQTLTNGSGTLNANTFTRDGYTFSGWATTADGEKAYDDKAEVNLTADTTLYAVWTEASATTTYTLDLSKVTTDKVSGTTAKVDDTISIVVASSEKNIQNKGTYIAMTGGKVQVSESASYGLQVTLTKESEVVITATCKKSAGTWTMIDTANTKTTYESDSSAAVISSANTDTPTTLTFKSVAAGTYLLGATANGGNLYSLVITY